MLLRKEEGFRPTEINVFWNTRALGDNICRIPSLLALLKNYPDVTVHLYSAPYLDEILDLVFVNQPNLIRHDLSDMPQAKQLATHYMYADGGQMHAHTTLGSHLVDWPFRVTLDRDPTEEERSYPQIPVNTLIISACQPEFQGLSPRGYVILTPGYTAPNRALPGATWNAIAEGVIAKGLTPVWIGKREVDRDLNGTFEDTIDFSKGADLRDKTTLLQAAGLMEFSRAVIGLDNGLLHLAGMTDAYIIAGYSSVLPKYRLPIREGKLGYKCAVVNPKGCNGCENKIRFAYDVDFRYCYFGDYACLSELTADKFLAEIPNFV